MNQTAIQAELNETMVCNGFAGCGNQPQAVELLPPLILVVLSIFVLFVHHRVEPPSSGEDEDLSETKALYVSGDIDSVVELESELEDVLDGEGTDNGNGDDGDP